MYTRYNIKVRLVALGKKSKDMVVALNERGVETNASQFSAAINSLLNFPKCDLICETADKILTEWEKKCEQTTRNTSTEISEI